MAIVRPKGTNDIIEDSKIWVDVEKKLRMICNIYNYKEIRTPIFEHSELFHRSVGEGSDLVRKETYDFKDRGDRNITLRPEGTAGAVRSYIENKMYAQNPITKLFYIGSMFRYERPQKGRCREFHQFGVEAFGSYDPIMDADVIALATTIIKAFGLTGIKVRLNSLGDDESREAYKKALVEHFSKHVDELCSDCKDRLIKNPLRILDCKVDKDLECYKNAPKISDYLSLESKKHFEDVLSYLDNMNIDYELDPNLVRGLDYYTNTIFEVEATIEGFGAQNVLCGGGRYNNLVESLEGPKTPAVGFAFGLERFLFALEQSNKISDDKDFVHLYLMALGDNAKKEGLKLANMCRFGGLITEVDYLNKGMKGQFKLAEKYNAKYIAILGDDELNNGTINVKNVKTQEQITINSNDLYNYILNDIRNGSSCGGGCHGEGHCGNDCHCKE